MAGSCSSSGNRRDSDPISRRPCKRGRGNQTILVAARSDTCPPCRCCSRYLKPPTAKGGNTSIRLYTNLRLCQSNWCHSWTHTQLTSRGRAVSQDSKAGREVSRKSIGRRAFLLAISMHGAPQWSQHLCISPHCEQFWWRHSFYSCGPNILAPSQKFLHIHSHAASWQQARANQHRRQQLWWTKVDVANLQGWPTFAHLAEDFICTKHHNFQLKENVSSSKSLGKQLLFLGHAGNICHEVTSMYVRLLFHLSVATQYWNMDDSLSFEKPSDTDQGPHIEM